MHAHKEDTRRRLRARIRARERARRGSCARRASARASMCARAFACARAFSTWATSLPKSTSSVPGSVACREEAGRRHPPPRGRTRRWGAWGPGGRRSARGARWRRPAAAPRAGGRGRGSRGENRGDAGAEFLRPGRERGGEVGRHLCGCGRALFFGPTHPEHCADGPLSSQHRFAFRRTERLPRVFICNSAKKMPSSEWRPATADVQHIPTPDDEIIKRRTLLCSMRGRCRGS